MLESVEESSGGIIGVLCQVVKHGARVGGVKVSEATFANFGGHLEDDPPIDGLPQMVEAGLGEGLAGEQEEAKTSCERHALNK